MSKLGKCIVAAGFVLVLAACATPDGNQAGTQRPQATRVTANPSDGGGGGGGGGY
ncbi:MAG TPA: hypothetical protein VKI44_25815 [Acetobacteraceae bacterium]|nr:hypothetical protein [Acetobacteraceae bacterium]